MSVAKRVIRRRENTATTLGQDAFESEFAFESLKSEQLRVTILIGAIVSSLMLVIILATVFFDEFQTAFHGNFKAFLFAVSIIFGLNLFYLLGERLVLDRLIKTRRRPIPGLKYVSAFGEEKS